MLNTTDIHKSTLRVSLAVCLAMIITHYFSKTHSFWMVMMAFLLAQAEFGFPLRQSLQRFFWIVLILFLSVYLYPLLESVKYLLAFMSLMMLVIAYSYAYILPNAGGFHFALLWLMIILLSLLMPAPFTTAGYVKDILVGAAIGMGVRLIIYPDKPDFEFSKRMQLLLKSLSAYFSSLMDLMLHEAGSEQAPAFNRQQVEDLWVHDFPAWVYVKGFNPRLKAGQYYFMVHLGQIVEILFAMNHFAHHPFEQALLTPFRDMLKDCKQRTQELIETTLALLEGKQLTVSQNDFIEDIQNLENTFQAHIPINLELLGISRDYINLAAFICYIKELRMQLLQLAATMRR